MTTHVTRSIISGMAPSPIARSGLGLSPLFTLALLVGIVGAHNAAFADDDPVAAKASYETGTRHYNMAEYAEALQAYKEAYKFKPDPAFLYNIGQCHRMLGHVEEALAVYKSYLREAPEARNRAEVERKIEELQSRHESKTLPKETPYAEGQGEKQIQLEPVRATDDSRTFVEQTPVSQPGAARPFYTRWWFWSAIGVVVAGSATLAIVLATRDPTKIPSSGLGAQGALP